MKYNETEILKAKVDFSKTIFIILFGSTITSAIGSYNLYNKEKNFFWSLFWITIILGFTALLMFKYYDSKHRDLIDYVRKK